MTHKMQKFNPDGHNEILLIYDPENHTFWASQSQMGKMYGVTKQDISHHIKAIEIELGEQLDFKLFSVLASDKKTYRVKHYNQQVIEMVKSRLKSGKTIFYEKSIFHKQVEIYLKSQGFLFIRYEVPMFIQGKADFVAYHPEKMVEYVIECKTQPFRTRHCSQVWDYTQQLAWNHEQFPEYNYQLADTSPQMALAYPEEYAESIHWEYCRKINVQIFLIP